MGQCRNCQWFYWEKEINDYKRDCCYTRKNYCWKLERTVDPSASCNYYFEKPTPENSGYTGGSESSGCFLTSACVEYMGKMDGCEELTVLRAFRDGYMQTIDGGAGLIKEYYSVAPNIVDRIKTSDGQDKYFKYIYGVVERCVKLISSGENERALNEYKNMVNNLRNEFNL